MRGPFVFFEMLCIVLMLWLILNLIHYIVLRSFGDDDMRSPALFGLSNIWLAEERRKRDEKLKEKKEDGVNLAPKRRRKTKTGDKHKDDGQR